MKKLDSALVLGLTMVLFASPAPAQVETTTYTYDAIGRVVNVEADRPAETVTTEFQYDDADNRTLLRVTETLASAPSQNSDGIEQVASAATQPE